VAIRDDPEIAVNVATDESLRRRPVGAHSQPREGGNFFSAEDGRHVLNLRNVNRHVAEDAPTGEGNVHATERDPHTVHTQMDEGVAREGAL